MPPIDTAKAVLAKASLYDQSFAHPDAGIAVAWCEALGDIDRDAALRAVTTHYRQPGPRRIMPGDVIDCVRTEQRNRREADRSARVFAEIEAAKQSAAAPEVMRERIREMVAGIADRKAITP